jgi:hypothetical protein
MADIDVASALDQLAALARNLGVSDEELAEILHRVNEEANASEAPTTMGERLIEARARLMRAALS